MIRIEHLEFHYSRESFQLCVPDFAVPSGEKLALIGPSGSGKTTLLYLVAGILEPLLGDVKVADQEISCLDDSARRQFRVANIGLVFQEFELIDYLSVADNILLPYRITNSLDLTSSVRKRAGELAGRVGLGDKVRRLPKELSHGERQRVAICRALITQPKLVLADEPTGNLDAANKQQTVDLLCEYATEHAVTLLMVTHDESLLSRFDRVENVNDLSTSVTSQSHMASP